MKKKKIKIEKKKIVADFMTPVSAYTCFKNSSYSFLLESVERGKTGRYSFIGLGPLKVYMLCSGGVRILGRDGDSYAEVDFIETQDPLGRIQDIIDEYELEDNGDLPPFAGGLVGYVSYEIIRTWENINFENPADPELPLGVFMFTDEIIAFDHLFNTAEIIKLVVEDEAGTAGRDAHAGRLEEIERRLKQVPDSIRFFCLESREKMDFRSNFTREKFEEHVRGIKEEIMDGQIIQAVFSQRLETVRKADPFNYYRALRIINPSPYMFYLRLDDIILCGSSPEVLVKVKDSTAVVRPIAGTRPRGATPAEEEDLVSDLISDEKEKAEHVMLVDLGRNDLGKVCEYGSVKVDNLMSIEKYSHVIHMVTDVSGQIRRGMRNTDVLKACFPAGTVSGAPKIRAIKIVEEKENLARGPYAGAAGYFSFTKDMDMCIGIRTMLIHGERVFVQAGAGIVADSVPGREYEETLNKAMALMEAVKMGEKI